MSGRRRDAPKATPDETSADETLAVFISLGRQLAVRTATANFRAVTASPGCTQAQVDAEVERRIDRMEIASRDAIAALGGDPDGAQWHAIWTGMQESYRETVAGLLAGAKQQTDRKLH